MNCIQTMPHVFVAEPHAGWPAGEMMEKYQILDVQTLAEPHPFLVAQLVSYKSQLRQDARADREGNLPR